MCRPQTIGVTLTTTQCEHVSSHQITISGYVYQNLFYYGSTCIGSCLLMKKMGQDLNLSLLQSLLSRHM